MSVLKEDDDEDDNTGGISIKASSNTNKGFSMVDQYPIKYYQIIVILLVCNVIRLG